MFSLPDPLHPAVVHMPLALAVVLPALAVLVAAAIRLKWFPVRTWWVVLLLQAALVGFGYLALETGEDQEEVVEEVIGHDPIHEHEERAERFLWAGAVVLAIVAAGLLPGGAGSVARVVAVLGTLGVMAAAVQVGHSGGELVYRHGAANAYLEKAGPSGGAAVRRASPQGP